VIVTSLTTENMDRVTAASHLYDEIMLKAGVFVISNVFHFQVNVEFILKSWFHCSFYLLSMFLVNIKNYC